MPTKKNSILLSLLPTVAALGLMYKMSLDQQADLHEYTNDLAELQKQVDEYKTLEANLSSYCSSLDMCPEEIDRRISAIKNEYRSLENEVKKASASEKSKDEKIESLRERIAEANAELAKTQESLRLTKQTVDAQISLEMGQVNEKIEGIHKSYEETINKLKERLEKTQQDAQRKVAEKEAQFKEIHKKSVNNLLGMVDSLAKERETLLIPLISTYDDQTVHDDYLCRDSQDLKPSEMIFAKHMDRHWLSWPVTVIESSSELLSAQTEHGYTLRAEWENQENMYDLERGDQISIQFLLEGDQSCADNIEARRTVITTQ